MCFQFIFVINIWVNKIVPIYDISIFYDRNMNLVDALWRSKLKIPSSFRKIREQVKENSNFYAKLIIEKIN